MIPSFLLAKLCVKGWLKNTETGFEFGLKNIIDSTMLIGIDPVTVGERDCDSAAITLTVADKSIRGADLARQTAIPVHMGVPLKVRVAGDPLAPGAQRISVAATTCDIGKIRFDISDTVA